MYRPQSSELASEAARIANNWANYAIPYDEERKIASERIESSLIIKSPRFEEGIQHAVKDAHQRFDREGKFRAIKYAARRNTIPVLPGEPGTGKGLFCSMFVILSYQAAGLKNAVASIAESGQWVSDKHADLNQSLNPYSRWQPIKRAKRDKDVELYKKYSRTLLEEQGKEQRTEAQARGKYIPSLAAWQNEKVGSIKKFDFANAITEGMCVDAKTTMPGTLLYSIKQDPRAWLRCGQLQIKRPTYSEEEKMAYREESTERQEDAKERRQKTKEEIESRYGGLHP